MSNHNILQSRPIQIFLAGIVLLAVALIAPGWVYPPGYGGDATGYLEPIHRVLEGGSYNQTVFPPGFGLLALIPYVFVRNIPLSGVLVAFFSYLGVLVLSYKIACSLHSRSAGWFAVFLVGTSPLLIRFSNAALSEVPYTFFLLLTAYLAHRFDRELDQGPLLGAILGFSIGMCYLIRPEGALIAVLTTGFLIIRVWQSSKDGIIAGRVLTRKRSGILWACIVCAGVSLPYVAYLYSETGKLMISGKSHVTFFKYAARATMSMSMIRKQEKASSIPEYIKKNPELFAMRVKFNIITITRLLFYSNWSACLVFFLFTLPALVMLRGRVLIGVDRGELWRAALLVAFLLPMASFIIYYVAARFLIPYSTLIQILIAVLTAAVIGGIKTIRSPISWALVVALGCFGLGTSSHAIVSVFDQNHKPPMTLLDAVRMKQGNRQFTQAGLWLRENIRNPESIRVASPDKGHVALYFAGDVSRSSQGRFDRWLRIKKQTLDEVVMEMRSRDIRYLVLNDHHTRKRKHLRALWDSPGISERYGLRLLHFDRLNKFQIFELLQ